MAKINESSISELYEEMDELLKKGNILYCKYNGDNPEDYEFVDSQDAIDCLDSIEDDSDFYNEAQEICDEIEQLSCDIERKESEEDDDDDSYDEDED
jgi:hypothetical protein